MSAWFKEFWDLSLPAGPTVDLRTYVARVAQAGMPGTLSAPPTVQFNFNYKEIVMGDKFSNIGSWCHHRQSFGANECP